MTLTQRLLWRLALRWDNYALMWEDNIMSVLTKTGSTNPLPEANVLVKLTRTHPSRLRRHETLRQELVQDMSTSSFCPLPSTRPASTPRRTWSSCCWSTRATRRTWTQRTRWASPRYTSCSPNCSILLCCKTSRPTADRVRCWIFLSNFVECLGRFKDYF